MSFRTGSIFFSGLDEDQNTHSYKWRMMCTPEITLNHELYRTQTNLENF